jgi:hypothetical protein
MNHPYAPNENPLPPAPPTPAPPPPVDPYNGNFQHIYNQAWQHAYKMHEQKFAPTAIYDSLIQNGLDPVSAQQLVNNIALSRPPGTPSTRDMARKDLLIGFVLLGIGIALTVFINMARGDFFYVSIAPTVYGIYRIVKGFSKLST